MSLRKIVAGVVLGAAALFSGCQKPAEFTTGYNAIEVGYTDNRETRTRVLTNVGVEAGDFKAGYEGLNEMNNADPRTYFGRHIAHGGLKGLDTELVSVVKTTNEGVLTVKGGVRQNLPWEAVYGRVDVTANDEAAEIDALVGIPLGKYFTLELVQGAEFPYSGSAAAYTEVQPIVNLNDNFALFGRLEAYDFKDATYMVGIIAKF